MEQTDKTTCREYGTARPASGALEAADRVREQVRQVILAHDLLAAGDAVVLGFSGGPDSLCLFDVLYTLQEELDFSLSCVHVNHGLRPGDAEEDQAFVRGRGRSGNACHDSAYLPAYQGQPPGEGSNRGLAQGVQPRIQVETLPGCVEGSLARFDALGLLACRHRPGGPGI